MLGLVIQNHRDGVIADFRRLPVRCLAHNAPLFRKLEPLASLMRFTASFENHAAITAETVSGEVAFSLFAPSAFSNMMRMIDGSARSKA
jgi:hypothetical protein